MFKNPSLPIKFWEVWVEEMLTRFPQHNMYVEQFLHFYDLVAIPAKGFETQFKCHNVYCHAIAIVTTGFQIISVSLTVQHGMWTLARVETLSNESGMWLNEQTIQCKFCQQRDLCCPMLLVTTTILWIGTRPGYLHAAVLMCGIAQRYPSCHLMDLPAFWVEICIVLAHHTRNHGSTIQLSP
jgi:hypothetical protein